MKISIKNASLLLLTLLTASCSIITERPAHLCATDDGDFNKCEDIAVTSEKSESNSNQFIPETHFQTINEYTEQMVHTLYLRVSQQDISKTVAVPPFTYLSPTGTEVQKLNIGIAEAFIVDLQNIGLPVADFTPINTADQKPADFQDYLQELSDSQYIGYVLKGTMIEKQHGTMIYVNITDVETKKVIASTSKLVPNYLLSF